MIRNPLFHRVIQAIRNPADGPSPAALVFPLSFLWVMGDFSFFDLLPHRRRSREINVTINKATTGP